MAATFIKSFTALTKVTLAEQRRSRYADQFERELLLLHLQYILQVLISRAFAFIIQLNIALSEYSRPSGSGLPNGASIQMLVDAVVLRHTITKYSIQ